MIDDPSNHDTVTGRYGPDEVSSSPIGFTPRRRFFAQKVVAILVLLLGITTSGVLKTGAFDGELIAVRHRLFAIHVASVDLAILTRMAGRERVSPPFMRDPPPDSTEAAKWIPRSLVLSGDWGVRPTQEKVRELVVRMPGSGGGSCGRIRDLREKAMHLATGDGQGCCSDFSEVFVLAATQNGIRVREILSDGHVFDEYYDDERQQWVVVDPFYGLFAATPNGELLSASELAGRILSQEQINFVFFKQTTLSPFSRARIVGTYTETVARSMRIVMGTNVVQQDRLERKLQWLPKAASQFVGFLVGVRPYVLDLNIGMPVNGAQAAMPRANSGSQ